MEIWCGGRVGKEGKKEVGIWMWEITEPCRALDRSALGIGIVDRPS